MEITQAIDKALIQYVEAINDYWIKTNKACHPLTQLAIAKRLASGVNPSFIVSLAITTKAVCAYQGASSKRLYVFPKSISEVEAASKVLFSNHEKSHGGRPKRVSSAFGDLAHKEVGAELRKGWRRSYDRERYRLKLSSQQKKRAAKKAEKEKEK